MGRNKIKFQLGILKANALKLRSKYQLPFQLTYEITQLTDKSPVEWVQVLLEESKHMLRIVGYYKTYKDVERDYDDYLITLKQKYLD